MKHHREIGHIVRLQLQSSSLKAGPPKDRYFDPAPLRSVDTLELTHDGAAATIDGERCIDIHNATHPSSKNRSGSNAISIGFTSHYERMRERFDGHLVNGITGESILVETDEIVMLGALVGGVLIEGSHGRRIELGDVSVAHPCVEFSRFALGDLVAPARAVSSALRFLDDGMRGYYMVVASRQPLRLEVGDRVFAIRHD